MRALLQNDGHVVELFKPSINTQLHNITVRPCITKAADKACQQPPVLADCGMKQCMDLQWHLGQNGVDGGDDEALRDAHAHARGNCRGRAGPGLPVNKCPSALSSALLKARWTTGMHRH